MKQVISVSPLGGIAGLQHKPGQGMDLIALAASEGGTADVVRASEIIWNNTAQKWTVEFKEGAGIYNGRMLDYYLVDACSDIGLSLHDDNGWMIAAPLSEVGLIFLFPSYDAAIKAEIAVLNTLRAAGQL
jgi:hypothetical protein